MAALLLAMPARADTIIRVATFNTDLARKGPGVLLRDILTKKDPQVEAIARVIAHTRPDVIALQGVDYDHDRLTLAALRDRIADHGHVLPYVFAARPNTGMVTGLDMDGDGRTGRAGDAQSYGEFAGQDGMAVLSRYPILDDGLQDFSGLLWRDLPGALIRLDNDLPLLSPEVESAQRLSSAAHWDLPIDVDGTIVRVFTFHASPPVFDGPEDRNGRRNHDEIVFWRKYLDGVFGPAPAGPFILAGNANLDPVDGDGRKEAIRQLLNDPRLQDPMPQRPDPVPQGPDHIGDPRLDTVDWPGPDPGALRVSYVLPASDLQVMKAGVFASASNPDIAVASRHKLVWVDVIIP